MFKAFIDDSKSDQDMREMVLAGYVATIEAWESFSDAWQHVLDRQPSIRWFHMVEAENRRDEFAGWTCEARDAKVAALADMIEAFEPWSVSCHMSLSQFDALIRPVAPYDLRHPYIYLMNALVMSTARLHAANKWKGPIDFVFDEMTEVGAEIPLFRASILEQLDPRAKSVLGQITQGNDKRILPLQAADLFAWHVRRAGELRYQSEQRYAHAKILGRWHTKASISAGTLRAIADGMTRVPYVDMVKTKQGSVRQLLRDNPIEAVRLFEQTMPRKKRQNWLRRLFSKRT